jgi:hypothetical protein
LDVPIPQSCPFFDDEPKKATIAKASGQIQGFNFVYSLSCCFFWLAFGQGRPYGPFVLTTPKRTKQAIRIENE